MNAVVALALTVLAGVKAEHYGLNISLFETIPYTAKNLTWWTDDFSGKPVASLCTRMGVNRGGDGQRCYPLPFWIHVCNTRVENVDKLISKIINEGEDWESANFNKTCVDYSLTWPYCVSTSERHKLCKVWKKVPPFERKYLTLFYEK